VELYLYSPLCLHGVAKWQLYVLTFFFLPQRDVKMYKSVDTVEEVNEAAPSRREGMSGGRTETSGLYRTQTPQPAHTMYSCLLCWHSAALRSDWLALTREGWVQTGTPDTCVAV